MNITKLTWGAVVLVALGAAGFGVWEYWAVAEAKAAMVEAKRSSEEARAKIASWEKKLVTEAKRTDAVESDNAALASAVQKAQASLVKPAAPTVVRTRAAFDARVKAAVALAKDGAADAALRELLECWAEGQKRVGGLEPVHSTLLLSAWIKLGEQHPPALTVLREKMEKARQRVLGSPDDLEPLKEMSAIARMLKDDHAMVALYDAIPEGDARQKRVAIYAVEGMIAAKRYSEVLAGRNYPSMSASFESSSQMPWVPGATAEMVEKMQASMRSYAVTSAAKNIEVLAGAGDLVHARELAGRVLALDGSEATRALVHKHLERAGQAGLLREVGK
jgi:hypothetical protein